MWTIRQTAAMTGLTMHALRYDEHIAVLPPPPRSPQGQRHYTDFDQQLIRFVRGLKLAGMSLRDMAQGVQEGCCFLDPAKSVAGPASVTRRRQALRQPPIARMKDPMRQLTNLLTVSRQQKNTYWQTKENPS